MSSQSSSTRYPIIAIPRIQFEAIQSRADERNPLSSISMNERIQGILNRTRHAHVSGNVLLEESGSNRFEEIKLLSKVRVTREQFLLLQNIQKQYKDLGYRISISSIVGSLLFELSDAAREAVVLRNSNQYQRHYHMYNVVEDGQLTRVKQVWHEWEPETPERKFKVSAGYYSLKSEASLPEGKVVFGW